MRSGKDVETKIGFRTYVYLPHSKYSKMMDQDSSIEVLRYSDGVKVIGEFHHIVTDNTGLPSVIYMLNHDGSWIMKSGKVKIKD